MAVKDVRNYFYTMLFIDNISQQAADDIIAIQRGDLLSSVLYRTAECS